MKCMQVFLTALIFALCLFGGKSAALATEVWKERGPANRGQIYIEAEGTAIAPTNAEGPQRKALARRGAVVDLHRNLLKAVFPGNDSMINDRASRETHGFIWGVELLDGRWDGKIYTVTGRVRAGCVSFMSVTSGRAPVKSSCPVRIERDLE